MLARRLVQGKGKKKRRQKSQSLVGCVLWTSASASAVLATAIVLWLPELLRPRLTPPNLPEWLRVLAQNQVIALNSAKLILYC